MKNCKYGKSLVIVIILLFVGCSTAASQGSPVVNSNIERFESTDSIDNLIETLMSFGHISALSVAIVKDDEMIWADGYGLSDREQGKEATEDVIYLVASISKTFTATALMQLYEQGLFDLDDDVNDYLNFNLRNPQHPDEKITFRMLLAHQSSIAKDLDTFFTRSMPGELEISGYPYPYLENFLTPEGIHYRPQVWNEYPPGDDMYYANAGFAVLGYLVEQISGQPFEEYCREHIFDPLDMDDTSFRLNNLNTTKFAVPYEYVQREYVPYIHYSILDYPAGGLRTTVLDLSRFLLAHMNGGTNGDIQILSPESVELMHSIQYESDTYNFQYGLGFQIWETLSGQQVGHTGGLYGVATKMVFRKLDNLGIIMFANKDVENVIERAIFASIEQLLFLKASKITPSQVSKIKMGDLMKHNQLLVNDLMIKN